MNYNVDSTRETGRSEFPKIRYLAGKQCMRPTHDTQYAIFMDKTFCRGAYAKKKIVAVSVFQVIAFLEKKTVTSSPTITSFSIFTCALVASRAQIALSILILLFLSVQLIYWQKRKIAARIREGNFF